MTEEDGVAVARHPDGSVLVGEIEMVEYQYGFKTTRMYIASLEERRWFVQGLDEWVIEKEEA